ncbi:unnamed protein product [Symbiodinium microadriaticum]|nr:unnamed protein product [Symbiodinium microadriaticum]
MFWAASQRRERACLTLQAHVLEMSEAPKQVRIRNNSGSDASKAVVGLVLGDASGLVQVELWGDAATKHHAQLWHAVNNVAEDMFVRVEVTHMEVSKPVSLLPHGKLLSTPRTIVTLLQPPGAFQLMPAPRLLVSNLAELRRQKPPYTMNIKGVVAELGAKEGRGNNSKSAVWLFPGGEPTPPGLASAQVPNTLELQQQKVRLRKKKARRNSGGSNRVEQESVAVSNIGAVHVAAEHACLTLQAHVLEMSEAPKQVRIRNNSGSDASKAVVGLVLGDASGLVQVELWGDAATKHHAQLWHAVNNVAEDMFVRVEVTHMEISKPVSLLPHGKLLSTPRTIVTLLQPPNAFQLMPAPHLLVSNLAELRRQKPPYTINIKGVVAELGEIR